jgi:hypothetical protein
LRASSCIIEWLTCDKDRSTNRADTAFFYCSRESTKYSDTISVIRCLVAQFSLLEDNSISPSIQKLYHQHKPKNEPEQPAKGPKYTLEEWSKILVELTSSHKDPVIIIDALDECDDPEELLYQLKGILEQSGNNIRLMISSRMHVEVRETFPMIGTVTVSAEETKSDVTTYIRCEVQERRTRRLLGGKHPELEKRLVEILNTRADGM